MRLLALRRGITATSTLARIDALAELGDLDTDEADYLRGAFALITGLQLRQQIRDYKRGKPVGNFVKPKALSEREKKMLKDALKTINEFRDRVRSDLTGEVF